MTLPPCKAQESKARALSPPCRGAGEVPTGTGASTGWGEPKAGLMQQGFWPQRNIFRPISAQEWE